MCDTLCQVDFNKWKNEDSDDEDGAGDDMANVSMNLKMLGRLVSEAGSELGILKKKQESRKERKHGFDQEKTKKNR